jgi:hypothetical protein
MKQLLYTVLLAFLATPIFAQSTKTSEDSRIMSLGSRPSFQMTLPTTDTKTVDKLWKDYVKEKTGGKLKWNKKTKENVAMGLSNGITPGTTADLYSTISERGDDVVLTVWLDKGSSFINSKDDSANGTNVDVFMREFSYEVERNTVQNQLNIEMEKQKELDKKLARLGKDKDNLYKDIQEWEEKIRKARESIKENESTQVTTKKEIEMQTRAIETVQKKLDSVGKN